MGYAPRAASLADRLRCELSADVTLETGSKGAFDIRVDGRLVYSKALTGRIPHADQVIERLRQP